MSTAEVQSDLPNQTNKINLEVLEGGGEAGISTAHLPGVILEAVPEFSPEQLVADLDSFLENFATNLNFEIYLGYIAERGIFLWEEPTIDGEYGIWFHLKADEPQGYEDVKMVVTTDPEEENLKTLSAERRAFGLERFDFARDVQDTVPAWVQSAMDRLNQTLNSAYQNVKKPQGLRY